MPVVSAGRQQLCECDLIHHRTSGVGQAFRERDRADEMRRQHHPPDPQSGRERLARRADIHHPVGRDALQRTDGRTVVTVFGVVVVLDHQVTRPRPLHQRGAARGGQHHAGRRLVGRSGQHRRRTAVREGVDVQAVIIDRHRNRLDTVVPQHHPVQPEARVLHRHRLASVAQTRAARWPASPLSRARCAADRRARRGCAADSPPPRRARWAAPAARRSRTHAIRSRQDLAATPAATRAAESCRDPVSRARSRRRTCLAGSPAPRSGALAASTVATRVPDPCLLSRNPSAVSWLYASTTRRRETPRSAASTRVDGSRVAGAKRPARMASRRPLASWRCSGSGCGAVEFDQQLRTRSGTRNRHQSGAYLEAIDDLA